MRRGCISLGNVQCDDCHRLILYPERYLSLDEDKNKQRYLCLHCAQKLGFVKRGTEKGDPELLFDLSAD